MLRLTVLLAMVLLSSGCVTRPYAVLDGDGASATAFKEFDVLIVGLDGQLRFEPEAIRYVPPGRHEVLVISTVDRSRFLLRSERRQHRAEVIELELEPCTHYRLKAVHESTYSPAFRVVVADAKKIQGCEAKGRSPLA